MQLLSIENGAQDELLSAIPLTGESVNQRVMAAGCPAYSMR